MRQLLKIHCWRRTSSQASQPATEMPTYTFKESMSKLSPHAQTLTLMMTGVGVLMYSASTLRNLQGQISHNDKLMTEKFESND